MCEYQHLICCLLYLKLLTPTLLVFLKLVKDRDLNRVKDLLINKAFSVTLYDNLLLFRDTDIKFELEREIFKMILKKNKTLILLNYRIKN